MLGKIQVTNINAYVNSIAGVENKLIFVGQVSDAALVGKVTGLNANSDLETIFAKDAQSLSLKFLIATQLNAGQNWEAVFVGIDAEMAWQDAVDIANKIVNYEGVVVCDPISKASDLTEAGDKMKELEAKYARYMFALMCAPAIDNTQGTEEEPAGQSWTDYVSALSEMTTNVVSERVMCVPTLFENDLGILAGRLCNRNVTIADSPMRTKTGVLLGMGSPSLDNTGAEMPDTIFSQLDGKKFSVPQTYPGDEGWYWADGNTFDKDNGDYKVIEILRPALKACREVYKVALPTIADRALNSSPNSVEMNKELYLKPLREMSVGKDINGVPFPGLIYPPEATAIDIVWVNNTTTQIMVTVRPYNSQKDITIGVGVDLSLYNSAA